MFGFAPTLLVVSLEVLTIFLNCLLLFLVLFFVYPLKFVFAGVIPNLVGFGRGSRMPMTEGDARMLMWVYSAGFVVMMLVFVLL